ncbi:MAG: PLP-dependent aminotransferase family protein [Rhodobacteraceae bacterium]|nr:PLP-dependent aminotransferase family protein [Paracoccaceae bacterium]
MALVEDAFFLDPNFQGSLQKQIQQIVASAILAGRLHPGEKLPSSRKLAKHLGISRITVTLAYNELVSDDYITSTNRSGFYVSETAPSAPLQPIRGAMVADKVDWSQAVQQDFTGGKHVHKPENWRSYPYPFIYGQPDPTLFNQASWRLCALQALGKKEFDSLTSDYAERDDPELINFIARNSLPRRGILAKPEQILVTVGAQNALWMVAQILLNQDRAAAFEDPGYYSLREILRYTGCTQYPIKIDDDGLPPDQLPDNFDVLFTTPSHQCPTTTTMPMARRHELLRLAREKNFIIVEDDYEFEMSFLKSPSPALKSLDEDGRVIYTGSFSKSLFPGLRLGYLVASEPFIRQARALRSAVLRHPPGHMQRTTAYFLGLGHYDAMIKRMRSVFHERRTVMDAALKGTSMVIAGSASFGASSFWVEAPADIDTELLADNLKNQGVLIEAGAPFFESNDAPKNFFRLAYSSIPSEKIPEGIRRIEQTIVEMQSGYNST